MFIQTTYTLLPNPAICSISGNDMLIGNCLNITNSITNNTVNSNLTFTRTDSNPTTINNVNTVGGYNGVITSANVSEGNILFQCSFELSSESTESSKVLNVNGIFSLAKLKNQQLPIVKVVVNDSENYSNHIYFINVETEIIAIGNNRYDYANNTITCFTYLNPSYYEYYNPQVTNYLQTLIFANTAIGHYQFSLQNVVVPNITQEQFLQMFTLSDYPLQSLLNF
jgi:hypothetical protein